MTFPAVRQYGLSLFASAGVAGIRAGLAARPVLSNLMAGVQLAMTQPIPALRYGRRRKRARHG
jgi:small-conductance mechanosensitive channel